MNKINTPCTCIISGETKPVSELTRFVISPENMLIPDLSEVFGNRGFYIDLNVKNISLLTKGGELQNKLLRGIIVPKNFIENLKSMIRKRLLGLISLAKKAGKTVIGFNNLKKALDLEKIGILIQAYNGSKREVGRLELPKLQEKRIQCLHSEELGLAFGRDTVIHAGIVKSGFTKNIILYNKKYEQLRDVVNQLN